MKTNNTAKAYFLRIVVITSMAYLLHSCATYAPQFKESLKTNDTAGVKPTHTFFLAGGLGNLKDTKSDELLTLFKQQLKSAGKETTLIFTGDNVSAETDGWDKDKSFLERHLALVTDFKGETVFIPGNNEWKDYKAKKVERIEDYIKDFDDDTIEFFPENACPLEHRVINDQLDLILIDSKWFISNWSRIEDMNKKCTDIVTRRRFVEELEGYINDGQGKNIVIAMHHPVFSNGVYAGNPSFKQHMTPLPIFGTITKGINDLGAFSPTHLNSRRYNYLRILVSALAQASDRITVVSGHEESLQYLSGGNMHQVISGSLGSNAVTNRGTGRITAIGGSLEYEGKFTAGQRGFAKLQYFEDGSSKLTFIRENDVEKGTNLEVLPKFNLKKEQTNYTVSGNKTKQEAVLQQKEDYNKGNFYKFLWGERYRSYFGLPVTAPVVSLDTLYGGLKVTKEGGGHQSFSLRLEDKNGGEYAMRSLQKSALKFLRFKLPGIAYNQDDYKDTWAEEVISDFFTTAHPYMQLVINPMAKAVEVNHSDSELFYIPKQKGLGEFNEDFGNELYFIERRPSEEQQNYKGYRRTISETSGKVTDFESTTDMLEKIKSDESYTVDQRSFIRARIFDMLIGDWDRHQDQWRWIEYEGEDGNKEFMPVPRDRDNAFPRFDGFAMKMIKLFVPVSRSWQSFDSEIGDVKWLNNSGAPLDRALLTQYGTEIWEEEALSIQQKLTPELIDKAFLRLPEEVRDAQSRKIKNDLVSRLKTLPTKAVEYAKYLNKIVAVKATEKDDVIEVTRMPMGETKIVIRRELSDEANEKIYERTFNRGETKELWLYGLGDDDTFKITGDGEREIMIRCIGGYGDDSYSVTNKKRLKVYEWEHEKSTFENKKPPAQFSDIYKTNTYHWRYFKPDFNTLVPNVGFRTDDGLFIGATNTYVKNGLNGNPFRQKHMFGANYYFGFQAVELQYQGIFGNVFPKWNFVVDGYYTSDRYSNNFFGLGNETVNAEDTLDRDFYRARLEQLKTSAGISYHTLKIKALFESIRVSENENRFFTPDNLDPNLFDRQNYVGGEVTGYYKNKNAGDFPTKGLYIGFTAGYKANLDLEDIKFGYAALKVGVDHKLIPSGNLVLATEAEWKSNIGNADNFFFYHAPSIGGSNGLRGFRDERFSGKSYFYHSSDLKLKLKRYITAVSPVTIGIYGGFDYGRVWVENDESNIWHTSQGVGLWVSSLKALTFSLGYFNSIENNLVQVGFGLSF
ncbi:MAG: metallophosphoesterase [Saonia sp.]